MKTRKTFELEIQRSNVTPAQFLAYVRSRVDAKGGEMLRSDLSLDYFKRGDDLNFDIHHKEPEFDGLHEKSISKPYEMQTFLHYSNGAVYNEICEFEFDSEKTGHGYYYLVNVEAVVEEPTADETVAAIEKAVNESKPRSAWDRGVKAYAEELVEELREAVEGGYVDADDLSTRRLFEKAMLNGASDWWQFSEGGCSLIYDQDIAERLCTKSELIRTEFGKRNPNSRENWITAQGRALYQAAQMILRVAF